SALLGASPGASVSTNIILEVVQKCFADVLATPEGHERMKRMVPTYDEDLIPSDKADRQRAAAAEAERTLGLRSD
ncbi:MAG: malate:quinone oxidoreductase, partial [Phycisphaeraceae bacterium]